MGSSSIEWTDATWNPIVGCTKVSAGCKHCYAEKMSIRLALMANADEANGRNPGRKGHYREVVDLQAKRWNRRVPLVPEALGDPLRWKKPRRVFVNSMSDLFHEEVPDSYIDKVFAVMALCPGHSFQVLTKRPTRAKEYLLSLAGDVPNRLFFAHQDIPKPRRWKGGEFPGWPLPNVWLGASIEDRDTADERIIHLVQSPAAVRFLSCEPLLGWIDLEPYLWATGATTAGPFFDALGHHRGGSGGIGGQAITSFPTGDLHWVIAGGESGPGARPMHPDWARSLRDQCSAAGVPFFFKQWGAFRPVETGDGDGPGEVVDLSIDGGIGPREDWGRESTNALMIRVGKHVAGAELDGRLHQEWPS